ncbi:MAG: P-loop NTPase fold protein [Bacteroidota bacterium]
MKPFIIGITGGSGSGKTTFIQTLREAFDEEQLCVISQDDYYRPREEQKTDKQGITNFDLPRSIDKRAFIRDIGRLVNKETVERMEYTFNNEKAEPSLKIFRPTPIIIVEGLFVFHFKKMRKMLDLKIYLHAKENLKVIRRIKRDRVERNYPLEDVLYRYENHVLPAFEKYIKPYQDQADLIINNNQQLHMGLRVVQGFLSHYLHTLPPVASTPPEE